MASFVIRTLPIVSKYSHMLDWITGLLGHTKDQTAGHGAQVEFQNYLMNWKYIFLSRGYLSAWYLLL